VGIPRNLPLIRTSERGDFACQWYWYHHWVLGLSAPRVPTWSWFGTAVHKALEVRYPVGTKRGHIADVLDAFEAAVEGERRRVWTEGAELDEEEVVDGIALGRAMLIGYVKHYGQDQHWDVIHSEQTFQILVPNPKVDDKYTAWYCGTWDLVVWDRRDKVFRVVDHKTRKTFVQDWSFYDHNNQAGSYLWVAPEVLRHKGILGKKDVIDGIIFNILKKAMPDERPRDKNGIARNQPKKEHYLAALSSLGLTAPPKATMPVLAKMVGDRGYVVHGEPSAKQPGPLFYRHTTYRNERERVSQAKAVIAEAYQMRLVRKGIIPMTKHKTEDCVRCPLFDMCLLDEQDPEEAQQYARTMLVKRDPYADHKAEMLRDGIRL
jgi:hypothetical protein